MKPAAERRHRRTARGLAARHLGAAVCALGAACTSLPPEPAAPAAEAPAQWSQAGPGGETVPFATWWQRFEDPLLLDLVTQATQAHTSVQAAQAALRQARALRIAAEAARGPRVGGVLGVQQGTSDGRSTGGSARATLDASWETDLFGGLRSALRAAQANEQASAATLADVQRTVAAEAGLTYITLRSGQAREAIAADNLASQLRTLQLTEWRLQAGLLSGQEGEQARAAAAQLRAQLPLLRSAVVQAGHALAVLTGQPPAALDDRLATPRPVPQPAGALALSVPADTLRQRPDVRAAQLQVVAALSRVAQADAARYPSLSLGGSLGLQALTLGGGSTAVLTTVLASLAGPVWDGGAARAQVSAQQAAADQSLANYRGAVLQALQEVEDALVALQSDRQRVQHLQQAVAAATQAATLARQRFDSGLVDLQPVLETQRTQLATQDSLATAGADVSSDHVRLFKALGGGWQPGPADAPNPNPEPTPTR